MATEICTNCGSGLDVVSNCYICEQPYQMQCAQCMQTIENPAHTECIIRD